MKEEYENALKREITHIFESGANEMRVFEMVKLFLETRFNFDLFGEPIKPEQEIYFIAIQGKDKAMDLPIAHLGCSSVDNEEWYVTNSYNYAPPEHMEDAKSSAELITRLLNDHFNKQI